MSNIQVRIRNPETIRARLRPQQGIRVGNSKKYLFDPDLVTEYVEDARDWAIKTDGLVDEEDYSSKAWAIGGTGTETNNSKYWAEQSATSASNASTSETNAGLSATSASNSASTATTQAGIATTQAGIATTKAGEALTSANNASSSASSALGYANSASSSATTATTQAGIATTQAGLAKQWAIGEPTEPAEGSAKYWAEQASHSVAYDGQLDIQVNGTSIATFTANQATNTTADITIPDSLPDQTGNAGKFLNTDGTDASWQYGINYKGSYSATTQYYPGDVVQYYYDNKNRKYLCIAPIKNSAPDMEINSYWTPFDVPSQIRIENYWGDKPILPFIMNGSSGRAITGVVLTPGTTSTITNFPTINTSTGLLKAPSGIDGYYTSAQVDALIPTVNNSTITFTQGGVTKGSFTLNQSSGATIALDAGGVADIDGVTIDTNSDDELESIGTVNKNTAVGATAVKYDWIGTLAEYNSQNVETLHPEWICYITDDVSGGTSVYTKAEVDSAISTALTTMLDSAFPVGYRYITEASTCPLATLIPNSTWVLTSQGRVIQGADSNHLAGTTAEAGLPNITGTAETAPGGDNYAFSGAFRGKSTLNRANTYSLSSLKNTGTLYGMQMDASWSNPIYGNSTTVQPPAEFVNIFKRTA